MRVTGLTRMFSGSCASDTPGQAPLRPSRRAPCPRHPVVGVCYRGGLRLGRRCPEPRPHHHQAGGIALHGDPCVTCLPATSPPNGGNCTIRGATRRGEASNAAKPPIQPWVRRGSRGELRSGVARVTEHLGHHAHASHCSSRWSALWARVRRAMINAGSESPTGPCCTGAGRAGR